MVELVETGQDRVGRVVSVSGSQVVILIEDTDVPRATSRAPVPQKGTLVKIVNRQSWVFGLVTSIAVPLPARNGGDNDMRFAELALLGEIQKPTNGKGSVGFERGVSYFPTVGDPVYSTTQEDLSVVYARPAEAAVPIGTIHQDRSIKAYVAPDNLLGKHFAILGTTGSGKSCAAALVLHRLLEANANAHIVLLDPHNEYAAAFSGSAEVIGADTLELPYWLFSFEEFCAVVLHANGTGNGNGLAAESAILGDLIVSAKRLYPGNDQRTRQLMVDTPVPYLIGDLMEVLNQEMGRLNNAETASPYLRIKASLRSLESDSRYHFMFGGVNYSDTMARILARLFRIPVAGKPITILDLSLVPSDVLNIVVSVLCRISFDFAFFNGRATPILLVCEEAHRYVPQDSKMGFEPTKRILSRIAKEGRKYGLSLCIISQRPSDLAVSALSQCNTVFALRLTNQTDQDFVRGAMPDWGEGLMDFLPSLRSAEAVVVGEGISVPARVRFDQLPPERLPRSGAACFSRAWQEDLRDQAFVDAVVAKWRTER